SSSCNESSVALVRSGFLSLALNSSASQAERRAVGMPASCALSVFSLLIAHWMKYQPGPLFLDIEESARYQPPPAGLRPPGPSGNIAKPTCSVTEDCCGSRSPAAKMLESVHMAARPPLNRLLHWNQW